MRATLDARREVDGFVTFEFDGRIDPGAGGGRVRGHGTRNLAGIAHVVLDLTDVESTPFAPFIYPDLTLRGKTTGRIDLDFEEAVLTQVEATLKIASGIIDARQVRSRGDVGIQLELRAPLANDADGRLTLDFRDSTLSYAEIFNKTAGTPGEVAAQIVRVDGELTAVNPQLRVEKFSARVPPPRAGSGR